MILLRKYIVTAIGIGQSIKRIFIFEKFNDDKNVRININKYPNQAFLDKVKNIIILVKIIKNNVIVLDNLLDDLFNIDAKRKGQIILSHDPV